MTRFSIDRQRFTGILYGLLVVFLMASCSGSGSSSSDLDRSPGTGAVAFDVRWGGQSTKSGAQRSMDCESYGVVDITAEVYDESGELLVTGGPWSCALHTGTIDDIPEGTNRKILIMGTDADGNVLYQGEMTGITIVAGQTSDIGTIEAYAFMAIDGAYLQYRKYENGTGQYRGWMDLLKFGEPIDIFDLVDEAEVRSLSNDDPDVYLSEIISERLKDIITLKNSAGQSIPISNCSFWKPPHYFEGKWNTSTSTVEFSGPVSYSGISINLSDVTSLSPDDYTYEVTTLEGIVISKTVSFPGTVDPPIVPQSSMQYEWRSDGSLFLSWDNPGGTFDQYRVAIDEWGNDVFYGRLPSDVNELTIPAEWVQKIIDTCGPYGVTWQVQTRSFDEDDHNYVRGYSDSIDFAWLQPSPPEGTYDLMVYHPGFPGSWWLYSGSDTGGGTWQAVKEMGSGTENILGAIAFQEMWIDYPAMETDEYELTSRDGQYFYLHANHELENSGDLSAPGYELFDPIVSIKRFASIGETITASTNVIKPDGSQYSATLTMEFLGLEDVTVPAGTFTDCLKVKQTSVDENGETEVNYLWWAKDVGEVRYEELIDTDDSDGYLDTEELQSFQIEDPFAL